MNLGRGGGSPTPLRGKPITRAIGSGGPWKSRLFGLWNGNKHCKCHLWPLWVKNWKLGLQDLKLESLDSTQWQQTHPKKSFSIFPSPDGMSLTKLCLGGNNDIKYKLFPPRESLISDIPAGDGNIEKLFYSAGPCRCWEISREWLGYIHMYRPEGKGRVLSSGETWIDSPS